MKDVSGKVAVVTGGCMGIGRALAEKCMRDGVRGLVIGDLRADFLAETVTALSKLGTARVIPVQMDVAVLADVQRLLDTTLSAFGVVNLAFFNAGVPGGFSAQSVINADFDQWRWVEDVNFWGVLYGCNLFGKVMIDQARRDGTEAHIVNTASVAGYLDGFLGSYTSSKHGCISITERLLQDFAEAGVFPTVAASTLCPGLVSTNIIDQSKYAQGNQKPPSKSEWKAWTTAKGSLKPSEVADIVFDAVFKQDLYINSHPSLVEQMISDRAKRIIGAAPPVADLNKIVQRYHKRQAKLRGSGQPAKL